MQSTQQSRSDLAWPNIHGRLCVCSFCINSFRQGEYMQCDSCEVLYINGIRCHEQGCPSRFVDEVRECRWCGQDFSPEGNWQKCCSEDCFYSYNGY